MYFIFKMQYFIPIYVFVIFSLLGCNGQIKRGFGEYCNATMKCDKKAWLVCGEESKCDCMFPGEMIYNIETSICQSKAGERCLFQVASFQNVESGLMAVFEKTECVKNAECQATGICTCTNGYFETLNGTCVPQTAYGSDCTAGVECSSDKFLACINGTCNCDSTQVVHEGSCYGRVGNLVSGKGCVPGTVETAGKCRCPNEIQEYSGEDGLCHEKKGHMSVCSNDSQCKTDISLTCISGTCLCDPTTSHFEMVPTTNSILVPESCVEVFKTELGDSSQQCQEDQVSCESNNTCVPYLYICDGVKDCPGGEDELTTLCEFCSQGIGSRKIKTVMDTIFIPQCVGLAGRGCNSKENCVKNSNCINGTCSCKSGFAITATGNCQQGYGQECSSTLPCGDGFRCSKRGCVCTSPGYQVYSAATNTDKCLSLILGTCQQDADCIETAECQSVEDMSYKQCVCKSGYILNEYGTCDLSFGSPCEYHDESNQCDRIAELECLNGVCTCANAMDHFDSKARACLSIAGSRCGKNKLTSNSVEEIRCVENVSCNITHDQLGGICICDKKSNGTVDRLCNYVSDLTRAG